MLKRLFINTIPKPNINYNFNNPAVEEIKKLIAHLQKVFNNESNLDMTIRVLECLMFIKINFAWLRYAIENKSDPTIYTYKEDKEHQVLRAHNDMSFHVLNYDNADKAITDYTQTIESVEKNINLLLLNPPYTIIFISKIRESDVGCLEERLSPALKFLADPTRYTLDDIFTSLWEKKVKNKIDENNKIATAQFIVQYFAKKIDKPLFHNGELVKLNWAIIKKYFCEILNYEDSDLQEIDAALKQEALKKEKEEAFRVYAITLREKPTRALRATFFSNPLLEKLGTDTKPLGVVLTEDEHDAVQARHTWSKIIADAKTVNQQLIANNVKVSVIKRIQELGFNNPEKRLEDCITYIKTRSVLTMSFAGSRLRKGLNRFQLDNCWENKAGSFLGDQSYRDITEKGLFGFLSRGYDIRLMTQLSETSEYKNICIITQSPLRFLQFDENGREKEIFNISEFEKILRCK